MFALYGTYVLRCWGQDKDNISRVEIVHVQTGERALVHSTDAVLQWIKEHPPKPVPALEEGI